MPPFLRKKSPPLNLKSFLTVIVLEVSSPVVTEDAVPPSTKTSQKLWFRFVWTLFLIFKIDPSFQVIDGKEPPATLCSYTPVPSQDTIAPALIVIVVNDDVLSYVPFIIKSAPDPSLMVKVPPDKINLPPKSIVVSSITTLELIVTV